MRLAVIVSLFNDFITEKMLEECKRAFLEQGIIEKDYDIFAAPGSFEIPAMAQKIINTKKYDGIVTLGCVIRGETDHYIYICQGISYGIQKVSIENAFPLIFGILTCDSIEQAIKRINKGYDYGKQIVDLIKQYQAL